MEGVEPGVKDAINVFATYISHRDVNQKLLKKNNILDG